ncbi:hypothetical protein [Methylobacterium radiotolerans]|uniref:hypothetical protein n=1 Tax=Methylobacterium radiotolerans TaxID=31998 RepID=UPI001F1D2F12|nr:hypothetical protein [Methylobacterium radiotolerans]UIY43560.1 hypothetical protein LZ599_07650 [Methylobacterium radiotolerans]
MKFLTTVLYALAACAALLVGTGFWIDAPRREMQSTGLTAATVLGTDVTARPTGALAPGAVASGVASVGVTAGVEG